MRVAGLGTRAYPYTHDVTAIEAVTLATLKLHLRISGSSQDTVLQLYLTPRYHTRKNAQGSP